LELFDRACRQLEPLLEEALLEFGGDGAREDLSRLVLQPRDDAPLLHEFGMQIDDEEPMEVASAALCGMFLLLLR